MVPATNSYTELAELAGGFIHEIKNHISTLNLNLQLLGDDFAEPQTPRERRAFDRITRLQGECNRLVDISNDFLRFARSQQLQLQPTHLGDVIDEMVDFCTPTAKQAGITITWYPNSTMPEVQLDRELFKQALLNLMLNAQQAMPEGGEITLLSHVEPNWLSLDVIDTGCGIPPEQLEKIFQPFHTTKVDGNGLGLATTRKIVQAHGGLIGVESEVGRGTKFTIQLPMATPETVQGEVAQRAASNST